MRLIALTVLSLASPVAASDFSLAFPMACTLGKDCFVQNYVDRDDSTEYRDFMCNRLSYDGHKGTDIALHSYMDTNRDVAVLAAAAGDVVGRRNTMSDRDFTLPLNDDIGGQECGNGVVIDHGKGWVTQYCHLKQGSLTVQTGDKVQVGQPLGVVGGSGSTEFPHLHFAVRHMDQVIDPFDPRMNTECGAQDKALWAVDVPYAAGGLIATAIQTKVPDYTKVKTSQGRPGVVPTESPALILWTFGFGLQPDDTIDLKLSGPSGPVVAETITAEKHLAQFFYYWGKKRPSEGWPRGAYTGHATHRRGDTQLAEQEFELLIE